MEQLGTTIRETSPQIEDRYSLQQLYYEYKDTRSDAPYCEYHIDTHKILYQYVKCKKMRGNLSFIKPKDPSF